MIEAAVCRQSWKLNPRITGIPVYVQIVKHETKSPKSCFGLFIFSRASFIYLSILSIHPASDDGSL
jgi:hypothetical protein